MIGIILSILFGIGLLYMVGYYFYHIFKPSVQEQNRKALKEFADKELERAQQQRKQTMSDPEFKKAWDEYERKQIEKKKREQNGLY